MKKITYDVANLTDISNLVSLLSALFSIEKDFSPDTSKQQKGLELLIQNSSNAVIYVARNESNKAIGMVSVQLVISTSEGALSAWVEDMVIDAHFHGLGIGKQLLQHALDWAKHQGATRAQLLVDTENMDAIGFYKHLQWDSTQLQARRLFL